jgi:hypothetical protein
MFKKLVVPGLLLALVAGMQPLNIAQAGLDNSYWTTGGGSVDRGGNVINFDVRYKPANTWDKMWGKYLSVRRDKIYVVRFRAEADSYSGSGNVPVSIRLQQAYSPWRPYSEVKTVNLDSSQDYYEVKLYASASDSNAEITVHLGHAAAHYRFSGISIREETPDEPIDIRPLDSSYWSRPAGAMNYAHGKVDLDVTYTPSHPWEKAWGKNLSVNRDNEYVLSFDAWAKSHTSSSRVPISVRIQKSYSPYTLLSQEETINIDSSKSRYEIRLRARQEEDDASIVVWLGHGRAEYHFSNISVNRDGYEPPENGDGLSRDYWAHPSYGIDYNRGTIQYDLKDKPYNPYHVSWGKMMEAARGDTYVVKFRARADSYTSSSRVPISVRLQKDDYPWTLYSREKRIYLEPGERNYEIRLEATGSDEDAMISVWLGHQPAEYDIWNINIYRIAGTSPDPAPDAPLSYDYWANPSRGINYKDGKIEFDVKGTPGHDFDASWGRHLEARDNETYVVRFRAWADSYTNQENLPVTIRLQKNHSPWTNLSGTKTVYVDNSPSNYEVRLEASQDYEFAMVSVWSALERGKYYYEDIEIVRE